MRTTGRTLTADEALAGPVARHSLAARGKSVAVVADDLVGLHSTAAYSPYLSLRARLDGFARTDLDRVMWQDWALVRFRAMRLTMFVLPLELLEIAAASMRTMSETLFARWLRDSTLTPREFARVADAVDEALAVGPLTVRSLRKVLELPRDIDLPGVVGRMCDVGRLVGGASPRSWRSPVREYHRWDAVLPAVGLDRWDEVAAVTGLIRRYIDSYGPVTINDISWWTGFTKTRCRQALESLGSEIEVVTVAGWPGRFFRVAGGPAPSDPGAEVRALPLLDPYVQGYRDRVRFLDPSRTGFVYDGGGNAAATLVRGGRIIGVWQPADEPAESVRYHLFSKQPRSVRVMTENDLAAAGAMYFDQDVDVVEITEMMPLNAGGGRSAMHPLDGRPHRASRRQPD